MIAVSIQQIFRLALFGLVFFIQSVSAGEKSEESSFYDYMAEQQAALTDEDYSWFKFELDDWLDFAGENSSPFVEFMDGRPRAFDQQRLALLQLNVNPYDSFEANAKLWLTASQLFARGSDFLGEELGADDYVLARIGQALLSWYFNMTISGISHELGHYYAIRTTNPDVEIIFAGFSVFWGPAMEYPTEEIKNRFDWSHSLVSGLNMNELDAYHLVRYQDICSYNDGIAFLNAKLLDLKYHLDTWGYQDYSLDPVGYRKILVPVSKESFLGQMLLADLLSVQTWESLAAIVKYLVTGNRTFQPTVIHFGSLGFRPPLISYYLTRNGAFFNGSFFITRNDQPFLEVQIGASADFIGSQPVKTGFRIGGEFRKFKGYDHWAVPMVSPYLYLNFDRSMNYSGISLGTEIQYDLVEGVVAVRSRLDYSENDLIECEVKGQANGFGATLDIIISY